MSVENLPVPKVKKGTVLVRNYFSLISAGTERTSVETAQASMVGKAKSRPDLVKQVIENMKREGVFATYKKVQNRLDNYKELGYSCAGVVVESGVEEFKPGDRVACGGATANHSEFVVVPKNLVVKIPTGIDFEEAAFATVGSIALQGIRQADVRLGEYVAVIGLGLIGLITVQLLKANGCKVIGLDVNDKYFELAKKLGCDECALSTSASLPIVESFTRGHGTDAVIITAGTKSNEPVELSIQYARRRSTVVVVGAVGMNIPRSPFYEKEINFRISCSYGPGRYDTQYEEKGIDYPIGYVRWTENRNMSAVLELIQQKRLDLKSLITHKIPIMDGLQAYNIITGKPRTPYIGILLEYPQYQSETLFKRRIDIAVGQRTISSSVVIGFIGAGNFAQSYLLPNLKKLDVELNGVATGKAINAKSVAQKFGFQYAATDPAEIIKNQTINTVFIASRHDSHARYVLECLRNGKNVFVEKPLAVSKSELKEIQLFFRKTSTDKLPRLMVGFNRRYSVPFRDINKFFKDSAEPFVVTYRVHAGFLPKSHWTQDKEQGGRIIGEVCHFIDTVNFLINSDPVSVYAACISSTNEAVKDADNVIISIRYKNGSVGNILYLANGDSAVRKEYCEVFSQGKTAIMNNFEESIFFDQGKSTKKKYDGTKGHAEEIHHFINALRNPDITIDNESIFLTTLVTFKIHDSLINNKVVTF